MKQSKLTVIDFFCGAGGFSEGFRQMGFDIIHGYDSWMPAVETFNHNFGLDCTSKNILEFKKSIEEIQAIPDTDIIIGSPPCVSFSSSNRSGKADKSLGVELTETFLKIVAVKKHQPNSRLKAWFMENVANSKRYLQTAYTFKDLELTDWAKENRISPNNIAIDLADNTTIINSADYGAMQARKRLISGEILRGRNKKLIIPPKTHQAKAGETNLPIYNSIRKLKTDFPNPFTAKSSRLVKDIQYDIKIGQDKITDHFYDTGVYQVEWRFSKYWKQNHPFMGRMSFPENDKNPSRTITATKIANSRESIIYKSEIRRTGDGEYRLPTVREAAIIMGFPITYQFIGSEGTKWRLVGNAVCCCVSRALAKVTLGALRCNNNDKALQIRKTPDLNNVTNLNTYARKTFDNPPVKNKNARFRRHPIKEGNLTVTLSNYNIQENTKNGDEWFTSIQYGTGKGFPIQNISDGYYREIEPVITKLTGGKRFVDVINNGFSSLIADKQLMQEMYEEQRSRGQYKEPTELVDDICSILEGVVSDNFIQDKTTIFEHKKEIPVRQLFALYAINKISTIANQNGHE
jgi:DNA (cytosine-5)-methyltransferase 1